MRLYWWIKLFIKQFNSFFDKNYRKKMKLLEKDYQAVFCYLKSMGCERIKPAFTGTWKFYGPNHIRFSLLVTYNNKSYVAKAVKGWDDKTRNGIMISSKYSNLFAFIPRAKEIDYENYVINLNEYIDSFTLDKARLFCNKKTFNYVLGQLCEILDKLDEYKVVHCDIADTNIIIQKKTFKVYIVDFDTCNSRVLNLKNDLFPNNAVRQQFDKYDLYDDAWAIIQVLNNIRFSNVKQLPNYLEIIKRIGRNCHIVYK